MRHYEIVFLVHPDQSEQVPAMVDKYRASIEGGGGKVHRYEDWGRRQLAYTIDKIHKAHYILMNIECGQEVKDELENSFRFNDAVIRSLVLRKKKAVIEQSPLAKEAEDERLREQERQRATEVEAERAAERAKKEAEEAAAKETADKESDSQESAAVVEGETPVVEDVAEPSNEPDDAQKEPGLKAPEASADSSENESPAPRGQSDPETPAEQSDDEEKKQ